MKNKLATGPYKGVRDFYPDDMAVQRYIFDTWSLTAELFGYERYDASVLEPSDLYRSKGAVNEEMVNDQTYTFTDRGDREVTLRPEMTPTVARMVAGRRRELSFPVRWYSIPNLFRYERMQRGRLREHWQLNCDMFGVDGVAADVEIILLANAVFENFGAVNGEHFAIRVNNRAVMNDLYKLLKLDEETATAVTRLADRKLKMSAADFTSELTTIAGDATPTIEQFLNATTPDELPEELKSSDSYQTLASFVDTLTNEYDLAVVFDPSIVRGFDYYTGLVFEVFDLHEDNNRALLGGGRYDNLTELFGGEAIPGIGFGMGDVTMRDFLETHNLLTADITSPTVMVIPMTENETLPAQAIANQFRQAGLSVAADIGSKKVGKKLAAAGEQLVDYALVLGEDELKSKTYTLKDLAAGTEHTGTIDDLIKHLTD